MADWSDFQPDSSESGSGWENFQPEAPTLMQRAGKLLSGAVKGVQAGLDIASGMPYEESLEGKPLPKDAEDPLSIAARHPYITAAATGGALGPATPALAALGEGSGLATAALGAGEQMGFQGISDLGQSIAGPNHPVLGAIPGLAAPFAANPAIRAASGIAGGKLATEAAAQETGRIAAERAQTTAAQTAEEEAQRTRQLVQEQAQHRAEEVLGTTAPQAAALANPINVNAQDAQKLSAAKNALWQVRRTARQAIGQEYDPIFESVDKLEATPENLTAVADAASSASKTAAARGRTLGASTKKLLNGLDDLRPQSTGAMSAAEIRAAEGETEPLTATFGQKAAERKAAAEQVFQARGGSYYKPGTGKPPVTLGQLRGRLSELREAADAPGLNDTERGAIFDASKPIVKILDNAIPDEQKPILAAVNAKYSQVSKLFPRRAMRGLSAAATLPQLGEFAFSDKNRALTSMALAQMDEPSKALMRDAWSSWVMSEKGSGKELFNTLSSQKELLSKLGFPSDLSSVGDLYNFVSNAKKMETLPNAAAQAKFMEGVKPIFKESGYSKEALDAADQALHKSAGGHMQWYARYPLIYAPLSGLMGFGLYAHAPELVAPAVAFGIPYLMRKTLPNTELLPLYRQMVMAGWTKAGGEAYAKMLVAATRNGIQAAVTQQGGLRPDKETPEP